MCRVITCPFVNASPTVEAAFLRQLVERARFGGVKKGDEKGKQAAYHDAQYLDMLCFHCYNRPSQRIHFRTYFPATGVFFRDSDEQL
jgi:hypothetical protein